MNFEERDTLGMPCKESAAAPAPTCGTDAAPN
jgi:hypothetical protein